MEIKTQNTATKSEKSQIIVHCFLRDRQDITSVSARKHPRYHLGYILFSLDKKLGTQLLYTITGIVHRPPPHCSENELLFYANVGEGEGTKGAHFKAERIQLKKVDFSGRRPAMFCSGPAGGRPEASGVPSLQVTVHWQGLSKCLCRRSRRGPPAGINRKKPSCLWFLQPHVGGEGQLLATRLFFNIYVCILAALHLLASACRIQFPSHGSILGLLHWDLGVLLLDHQESPCRSFILLFKKIVWPH